MLDQGGLTGAGMADNAQKFTVHHGQVHVVHGAALKGRARRVGVSQMLYL